MYIINYTDITEYNHFLMNKLATLPNIHTIQSFFVLSEGKRETAYSLKLPAAKKTGKVTVLILPEQCKQNQSP